MGRVSLGADIKYIAVLAVLQVALVASVILLLCQCYPASSDLEDLAAMSEPVIFNRFICCNFHGVGDARIGNTFFATRWAVELHISRTDSQSRV